jgi:hypothetical protein
MSMRPSWRARRRPYIGCVILLRREADDAAEDIGGDDTSAEECDEDSNAAFTPFFEELEPPLALSTVKVADEATDFSIDDLVFFELTGSAAAVAAIMPFVTTALPVDFEGGATGVALCGSFIVMAEEAGEEEEETVEEEEEALQKSAGEMLLATFPFPFPLVNAFDEPTIS